MRFASLGSGSRGNGTLVESGRTTLLVDCGFSTRETERRLARLGRDPGQISAVLVTHEHSDHVAGVARLARKYDLPVWMTAGTATLPDLVDLPALHLFSCHDTFAIGDIGVQPFPTPHDAREPSQFVFDNGVVRLALLTDTGSITPHIVSMIAGSHGLLLECNHDARMLADGPYSPALKRRVGGRMGHLSNDQAADLLARTDLGRLQHLVAMHLSEQNNTAERARAALADVLGCAPQWVGVADQQSGLDWRQLS